MRVFPTQRALVRPTEKRDFWQLMERVSICGHEIPPGFVTDGASVPRLMTLVYPRLRTDYFEPALLHDYLLKNRSMSRRDIDLLFRRALRKSDAKPFGSWLLFNAVRLWGILSEGRNYWKVND